MSSVYFSSDRVEPAPIPKVGDWVYFERSGYVGEDEYVQPIEGEIEEIDYDAGVAWIVGDDGEGFEARLSDLEIKHRGDTD